MILFTMIYEICKRELPGILSNKSQNMTLMVNFLSDDSMIN